jgi:hypothetical protein
MGGSYTLLWALGDATIAWGNWKADKEAKQVALTRGLTPVV